MQVMVDMKGKVTALVAGLVLGGTGAAGAVIVADPLWERQSPLYNCQGVNVYIRCTMNGAPWSMSMLRSPGKADMVTVFSGRRLAMVCERGRGISGCATASGADALYGRTFSRSPASRSGGNRALRRI